MMLGKHQALYFQSVLLNYQTCMNNYQVYLGLLNGSGDLSQAQVVGVLPALVAQRGHFHG